VNAFQIFPSLPPLNYNRSVHRVDDDAQAFNPTFKENDMTNKSSTTKSQPMTQDAKARVYSATALENDGIIPPDSFATRAASAADKAKK
jgi:hypothetical protein